MTASKLLILFIALPLASVVLALGVTSSVLAFCDTARWNPKTALFAGLVAGGWLASAFWILR
jgi:hypothetical protein